MASSISLPASNAIERDAPDRVHQRRWFVLAALCTALLLVSIDNTILNVALPEVSSSLSASSRDLQWIVDSYVIVFAGLLLAAGTLSDRFGRRSALLAGIAIFGAGSLGASLVRSADGLIACRAVMGLGAAFILPGTLSILTNVFRDERERARAIAVWAAVFGLGIAVGPVVGGYLLEHFYWGSAFIVNAPVLVVATVSTLLVVPNSKDAEAPRIDVGGVVLSIVGLSSLVWAVIEAPHNGWTSSTTIAGFVVSAVAGLCFVAWERRAAQPMLDVTVFENPRFTVASVSVALTYFALFGSAFLLTQYLQFVRGYSALEAGVRYLPLAGAMMIVAPISARLVELVGTKLVIAGGMFTCCVGLLMTRLLTADSHYGLIASALVVFAVGAGATMAPATESIMGAVPPSKAGVGSAMNDATREVGGALGVAILGSLLAGSYRSAMATGVAADLPDQGRVVATDSIGGATVVAAHLGDLGPVLLGDARRAFVDGMHLAMTLGAGVVLVAAITVLVLLPATAGTRWSRNPAEHRGEQC